MIFQDDAVVAQCEERDKGERIGFLTRQARKGVRSVGETGEGNVENRLKGVGRKTN